MPKHTPAKRRLNKLTKVNRPRRQKQARVIRSVARRIKKR